MATLLVLGTCSTTAATKNLVWGMEPELVRNHLQQRNLREIKNYLNSNKSPEAMQEALLLGESSLYTIALIFAEKKEWALYHRAMMIQSYSGSLYGQRIAQNYMSEHEIFSEDDRLHSLQKYLKEQPKDDEKLIRTVTLALGKGKVELAQRYWQDFLSNRQPLDSLSLAQAELGLKLSLLKRDQLTANKYMRTVVLDYPANSIHQNLQKDLLVRPEWYELLRRSQNGPQLLQSLDWKVALLKKEFSKTLPQLFVQGTYQNGKEQLNDNLSFWWSQQVLIEDTGRAIFSANNYRSQSQNVADGRRRLQSFINGGTSLTFEQSAYNNLVYWSIHNNRNYPDMEKYRSLLRNDNQLRPLLLVQYLYFFKNAKHWDNLPEFLQSWQQEHPTDLSLNASSIRLFGQIYRNMLLHKKTALLAKVFQAALNWGNDELILESAWNYRLAKGKALERSKWEQIPATIRSRTLSDIRLLVFRVDQGEDVLPPLPEREPQLPMSQSQQDLYNLLSFLIDNGFTAEALRLVRIYHNDLTPNSIVDFSRRIQVQGEYDVSMRMAAQLTYDNNYNISREALELLYPKAFFELMSELTAKHKLPLAIFYGLVRQESYFAPAIVSRSGAVGLSQLMPATMKEIAQKTGHRNPDATDPETNLEIGTYYLRYLINHRWTNDFAQALMAYNAGLGNIRKWQSWLNSLNGLEFNNAIPLQETRLYVQKISVGAVYYSDLYGWDSPVSILRTIYPYDFPLKNKLVKTQIKY